MTARHGIVHSERSPAASRVERPAFDGMQTWLALPDGSGEIDLAFEHVNAGMLPLVQTPGVTARTLMGNLWGTTASTTCHEPTIYANIVINAGRSVPIDAEVDERAVLVTEGVASLDGMPLDAFTPYIIGPSHAATLRALAPSRAIFLSRGTFRTPRHVFWNFVSSSRDRINQAKQDWKAGHFPVVPGDETDYTSAPQAPLTVSYP